MGTTTNNLLEEWLKNNKVIDKDLLGDCTPTDYNADGNYPFKDLKYKSKEINLKKENIRTFVNDDAYLFEKWLEETEVFDKDKFEKDEELYKYPPSYNVIRIEAVLDLHNHTVDEAICLLKHFVERCFNQNKKIIKIIHGKGLHSVGGPKVKMAVLDWLDNDGKSFVRFHKKANRKNGGSGATIVWLN